MSRRLSRKPPALDERARRAAIAAAFGVPFDALPGAAQLSPIPADPPPGGGRAEHYATTEEAIAAPRASWAVSS